MAETLREVWEHLVSHQIERDIDGWVSCFAADGVVEWPFPVAGVPPRAEGREAIRAALAPAWDRARRSNRRISGHDHVVFHETKDPEVVFVEFDVIGETPKGPFRQGMANLLRIREGRVVLLRDFIDTGALNALIQGAAADGADSR
ncbi:MAG: nuclear transport factor 2 family protein [Kofleriaceae bacterium]